MHIRVSVRKTRRPHGTRIWAFFRSVYSVGIWFSLCLHKLLYLPLPLHHRPTLATPSLVWPAGHSVRDCILTQYLPVCVCTVHIAHVLKPVNWVYISMTDKIARCRHSYLCYVSETGNRKSCTNEWIHARSLYMILKQTHKEFHWREI